MREGEGDRLMWARLEPHHGFTLSFEIDFKHPAVDATGQQVSFDMGSGRYKRDIARARTFGFSKDVAVMRSRGLTLGGAMDNAIVASTGADRNVSQPSAALARVRLCASVNAVMVHTSLRRNPTRNSSAPTNSR